MTRSMRARVGAGLLCLAVLVPVTATPIAADGGSNNLVEAAFDDVRVTRPQ